MVKKSAASPLFLAMIGLFGTSSTVLAQLPAEEPECMVTLPSERSIQGAPWSDELPPSRAWYGSAKLAALLPSDGRWRGLGPDRAFGDKFWWWRSGYSAHEESRPDLEISATRLDGPTGEVSISNATNAFGDGWDSMLIGMEFPEAGCWEVTGTYNGSEQLTFVLQVGSE